MNPVLLFMVTAEGEISKDAQEDTEEIEVVLADREEVKRILKEEKRSNYVRISADAFPTG